MELRRMLVHSIWIGTIRPHIHPFCSPCWLRICPPPGKWWETDMGAWLWWICPCRQTGKDWMRQEMRKYPRDGLGRVTEHPLSGFRGEAGCLFFPFFFLPRDINALRGSQAWEWRCQLCQQRLWNLGTWWLWDHPWVIYSVWASVSLSLNGHKNHANCIGLCGEGKGGNRRRRALDQGLVQSKCC